MKYRLNLLIALLLLFALQLKATDSPTINLCASCFQNPIVINTPNFNQTVIPDITRGTTMVFGSNNEVLIGFVMTKDAGRSATVDMWIPDYPVNGVYLNAYWEVAPDETTLHGTPIHGNTYQWESPQRKAYLQLVITEVDAKTTILDGGTVKLGRAEFLIHVSADYNY